MMKTGSTNVKQVLTVKHVEDRVVRLRICWIVIAGRQPYPHGLRVTEGGALKSEFAALRPRLSGNRKRVEMANAWVPQELKQAASIIRQLTPTDRMIMPHYLSLPVFRMKSVPCTYETTRPNRSTPILRPCPATSHCPVICGSAPRNFSRAASTRRCGPSALWAAIRSS